MKGSALIVVIALMAVLANAQIEADKAEPLVIVKEGLYGYIDHRGKVVIEPQFLWASDFENGYGNVYVCGRYALVDNTGKLFSAGTPRAGNRLYFKKFGDKVGFVNDAGQLTIRPQFDEALPFSEGLAAVRVDTHWGFIDTTGRFIVPPRFDAAYYFREGVGTVEVNDTVLLIDRTGKELARGYEVLSGIASEGLIPVSRGDKYGYLDLSGNVAIPLTFDGASTFSEGLAAVEKNSKWGYIDKNGSVIVPFKFDSAGEFGEGLAPVKLVSESGFINRSGSFVFHFSFENSQGFWGSDFISDVSRFWTKSEKFGYVNTDGNVIWGPTDESPDHPPLLGWSNESKKASCNVVFDDIKRQALALPPSEE